MIDFGYIYTAAVLVVGSFIAVFISYLLLLLSAAAVAKIGSGPKSKNRTNTGTGTPHLHVVVIIPAHDEELVIAATLDSLQAQDYPKQLYKVVVVADNCTDSTARISRDYDVAVLERFNPDERGKGYALAWAVKQLLARPVPAEAFVIVDADTWMAPDFLTQMANRLAAGRDSRGCCALQGRYGVLNSADGWRAALMGAAFDLYNHVRPLGYAKLGLPVMLKGNGMGFTREVFRLAPWNGNSITEDVDYALDLIRNHDICVGYVPEARVLAQMPVTTKQAASQRQRWEGGRFHLLRDRALPILRTGIIRRNIRLCDAAFGLAVPPLADLAAMLLGWGCLVSIGWRTNLLPLGAVWEGVFVVLATGFTTYVLAGMLVAGAPVSAYVALLRAPLYAVWKIALYAVSFPPWRSSNRAWVRTERVPLASPVSQGLDTPNMDQTHQ